MGEPRAEVTELRQEGDAKQMNKNGKKGGAKGGVSFFTWFMVLALLGVWTSVAVVYFDLVDYQGVIGKLSSYDADGDGDFDVEDAKVLLGLTRDGSTEKEKPGDLSKKREQSHAKHVGLKLREALKEQLTIIHERVEARKIAKMALAEVRNILAKEKEEKILEQIREESELKAWEKAEARLREEGEQIEREDVEKAIERIKREKEEREMKAEKVKTQEEEVKKEKKTFYKAAEEPEKDGKETKPKKKQ